MNNLSKLNVFDPNSFNDLKLQAKDGSRESIKAVAQQFEALFMQIMLKAMRDAAPQEGMFDNDTTRMYQGMLDQQMSFSLAQGKGIGLADVLEKQLSGQYTVQPRREYFQNGGAAPWVPELYPDPAAKTLNNARNHARQAANFSIPSLPSATDASGDTRDKQDFVGKTWPHAAQAAQSLGVPPHFLVAQAALETGWGRSEIRRADGSPSYNLFNIKAGANWQGEVVEARTTEYANGREQQQTERFRAYSSYAEAFEDYAKIMRSSPRYKDVIGNNDPAGFSRALASGGFATDPAYADKLNRVIGGSTLRKSLLSGS